MGGWVVTEGLTHIELWVEYNLPYVKGQYIGIVYNTKKAVQSRMISQPVKSLM